MAGTGRCLQMDNYSNCRNPAGLYFRMEITKYSSDGGGSGQYMPQSSRGEGNPTDKRP